MRGFRGKPDIPANGPGDCSSNMHSKLRPTPARQGSRDPFVNRFGNRLRADRGARQRRKGRGGLLDRCDFAQRTSVGNWAGGPGVERLRSVVARGIPERESGLRQRDDGKGHPCVLRHRRLFVLHLLVQRLEEYAGICPAMLGSFASSFCACNCTHLQ